MRGTVRRRRPRSGGTTAARTSFQCRVADLVDATAPAMNARQSIPVIRDEAGVVQPPAEVA